LEITHDLQGLSTISSQSERNPSKIACERLSRVPWDFLLGFLLHQKSLEATQEILERNDNDKGETSEYLLGN